jgi:hypothetical protein
LDGLGLEIQKYTMQFIDPCAIFIVYTSQPLHMALQKAYCNKVRNKRKYLLFEKT